MLSVVIAVQNQPLESQSLSLFEHAADRERKKVFLCFSGPLNSLEVPNNNSFKRHEISLLPWVFVLLECDGSARNITPKENSMESSEQLFTVDSYQCYTIFTMNVATKWLMVQS